MKIRYLNLLTALAFISYCATALAAKPEKPGGADELAKYSAELTYGDFKFTKTLEGLSANRKGTGLPGNAVLEMDLMTDPGSQAGWNKIFGGCSALVEGGIVDGFDVLADNWSINYTKSRRGPDKIHITMRDLSIYPGLSDSYSQVQFDLDFHGEIDGAPFLPDSVAFPSIFQLKKYKLWAGGHGEEGLFICNSEGAGWDDWPRLDPESTLVITREEKALE